MLLLSHGDVKESYVAVSFLSFPVTPGTSLASSVILRADSSLKKVSCPWPGGGGWLGGLGGCAGGAHMGFG